ncbi:MAG: DNA mismatch repair protein MutS, partial [Bryobacteraceae bacterium]
MYPEYKKRLEARQNAAAQHTKAVQTIGNWRLAVVIAGAVLTWINYWLLPLPVAIFVALIVYHERVLRSLACETRAISYYERGIARLEDRWAGAGETGERFRNAEHPYADDLDLFGKGSLFQLLSAARTGAGEAMLASWLMAPANAATAVARQGAIDDLRPRIDLREDLALLGDDIRAEVHPEALARWGAAAPVRFPAAARWIALTMAAATVILIVGYFLQAWTYRPLVLFLLLQSAFAIWLRPRVIHILGSVDAPAKDLRLLGELLKRLEREP